MSTLSGKDLLELLDFVSPDREQDPDQLECEVTIFHRAGPFTSTDDEEHPAGLYAFLTEYPEEGIFGPIGGPVSSPHASCAQCGGTGYVSIPGHAGGRCSCLVTGTPVSHKGPDTTLSCDQIVRLKSALTWLGHSTPESMEECAAKQKSLVLALIREVEGLKKEMRERAANGIE